MKTSTIKQIIKEELKKILEGETVAPAKPTTKPGEKTKHPVIPKPGIKTKPKAKTEKEELDESDVNGMMDAIIKRYKNSKK
jgi:hypothetical protein